MAKTIQAIMDYVQAAEPHVFADNVMIKWINEIEGKIQTEVMHIVPEDCVEHTSTEDEVLVEYPHDKLYGEYLCARVCEAEGEVQKANNWIGRFNDFYDEFQKWFIRNYNPSRKVI